MGSSVCLVKQDLITDRAVTLLKASDPDDPLFMYLSHTVPHYPIQVTSRKLVRKFSLMLGFRILGINVARILI